MRVVTGERVTLADDDQAETSDQPATHDIQLEVVKLPEAIRAFVLLPKRWVMERDFAWGARFLRLARDYERLPTVLAGLRFVAFTSSRARATVSVVSRPSQKSLGVHYGDG